jgi:4-amino-4-deoxy-L-arabinose transferase-like glycosyltransferase
MPVYPLFLAACDLVFGSSEAMVRYVQAFVGAAVIPLTWLLARRFTRKKASLLAAALVALHPALILRVTGTYVENLYAPLLLLALVSLLWALEEPLPHRLGVAGAPLAIANLCHPTAAFLPALLPLFLPRIWSRKRKAILCVAYAGATAAFVALWTYHNYRTYHAFLPPRASLVSLWQGSPEFFHLMDSRVPISRIWHEQLNPVRNGGFDPFTVEGGRYFTARALDSIVAEPGEYAVYSILKLAFFWIGHPAIDWPEYAVFSAGAMRPYLSTLRIVGLLTATLLPLVALAVLTVRFVVDGRLRYLAPLLIVCGYFTLVHAITYPEVRFSEPLHPILVTLLVAAVQPREYPWRIPAGVRRQWNYT